MSWKSLTCVTVFCALLAGQAMAVPTLDIAGSASGGNTLWTVTVTPDGNPLPSSMALELAIEFPTTLDLQGFTVDGNWHETLSGVVIENPGQNPYHNNGAGGVTEYVQTYENVASKIPGGTGNVNAIFASLGSTIFQNTNPVTVMTFTTVGTTGMVSWDGFLAQDAAPNADFFDVSGTKSVGGGPVYLGDTNNDGMIDLTDLFNVQNNFGKPSPPNVGDTNGDGTIDLEDLFNVQNNFGKNPNGGALSLSTSAVPEPATVVLLTLCGIGGLAVARTRRK